MHVNSWNNDNPTARCAVQSIEPENKKEMRKYLYMKINVSDHSLKIIEQRQAKLK